MQVVRHVKMSKPSTWGWMSLAAVMLLTGVTTGCREAPTSGVVRGEVLYKRCVPCHGENGAGNPENGSPAIAGMSMWYVEAQLHKFRSGWRGGHVADIAGLRMRPMATSLSGKTDKETDENIKAVTAYVSKMPKLTPEPTLKGGDPVAGEKLYAVCSTCHGADAKGDLSKGSPNLLHTNDWYLATQLKNFKAGIRGGNPDDTIGAQMMPMAATLKSEQDVKDVVAYIQSLR